MKKTTVKVSDLSQKDKTKTLVALIKAQPDILQREPKLLEILTLDNTIKGNVTSIAGRQSEHLKKQLEEHQKKTKKLLDNAKRYDQLTNKIYDLINILLSCKTCEETIQSVIDQSPDLFDVDFVTLRGTLDFKANDDIKALFSSENAENDAYQHVMERMAQGKCLCSDRFPKNVLNFFFSDQVDHIQSVAFIPLIGNGNDPKESFGTLAFASKQKTKFSSKLKGTVHLERLGKATALTLERITSTS